MSENPFAKFNDPRIADNPFSKFGFEDPTAKPRSALGEIGTGLKTGATVEVPRQLGQALKWAGDQNGSSLSQGIYNTGQALVSSADQRAALPENQLRPDSHNMVTNSLASGAQMLAPSVAAPAVIGAGIAALPEGVIGGAAALGTSALLGSVPAGMSQARDTYERVKAAGGSDATAISAGRKAGAIETLGEAAGTYVGGKFVGLGGKALAKVAPVAGEAAAQGVIKPFVKDLAGTAAGEVGTEMAQNYGQAVVEKNAGVQTDPWQQAKDAVAPTLGMTALLAPFGLHANVQQARQESAAKRAQDNLSVMRTNLEDPTHPLQLADLVDLHRSPEKLAATGVDQAGVEQVILDQFKSNPEIQEVAKTALNAGTDAVDIEGMLAGLRDEPAIPPPPRQETPPVPQEAPVPEAPPMDAEWRAQEARAMLRNQAANDPRPIEINRQMQDYWTANNEPAPAVTPELASTQSTDRVSQAPQEPTLQTKQESGIVPNSQEALALPQADLRVNPALEQSRPGLSTMPTPEQPGALASSGQRPLTDTTGDLRGFSFAIVKDGIPVSSGTIPTLMEKGSLSSEKYYTDLADKLGGELYIAPTPALKGGVSTSPQNLIMGRTWDQIQTMQMGNPVSESIKSKIPDGAVKVYSAGEVKPEQPQSTPTQEVPNGQVQEGRNEAKVVPQPINPSAQVAPVAGETPTTGATTPIEYSGQTIYPTTVGGKNYFAVQLPENKGTGKFNGDTLHTTLDAAKKEAEWITESSKRKDQYAADLKIQEEKDALDKTVREDLDGFASDKSAMARGKIISALSKQVNYQGKVQTKRDLIRDRVAKGYTVDAEGHLVDANGEGFLGPDVLTKSGIEYARHLVEKKNIKDTSNADPTLYNNLQTKVTQLVGPERSKGVMDLLAARASSAGVTPEQYVNTRQLQIIPDSKAGTAAQRKSNKGAFDMTSWMGERKAIIHAFKGADVSTVSHELGHLFRQDLAAGQNTEMLQLAGQWAGVKDGKWSAPHEEKFARGFERYLREGKAPTSQMQQVFESFKKWLTEVYRVLTGSDINVKLSPQIRQVFDSLLTENGIPEQSRLEQIGPINSVDKLFQAAQSQPNIYGIPEQDTLSSAFLENVKERISSGFDTFKFNIVNKLDPLKQAQDRITEKYGQIPDHLNAYMSEALRASKSADQIKQFDKTVVTPFIKEAGKQLDVVQELAYANHAPEANARLRLTTARMDLDKLIAAQKGEAKAYTQQELQVLESVLVDSQATISDRQQAYYDLLHRSYGETEIEQELLSRRLAFEEKPSGMTDQEAAGIQAQHAKDSRMNSLAKRMAEIAQMKMETMLDAGMISPEEAAAWQEYKHYVPLKREGFADKRLPTGKGLSSMGRASKVRKGSDRRATNIFANIVADHEQAVVRAEKAKTAKVLKAMIEEYPDPEFWRIEQSKPAPYYDSEGNLRLYPDKNAGSNQIAVKIDGSQYLITFDEKSVPALRIAQALKNEFSDSHAIIQFMSNITRTMAMMNTTLSPEFLLTNLPRDIQTAMFNIGDTALKGMQTQVLKDIYGAAQGIRAAMRGDMTGEFAQAWRSYEKNGGKVAWISGHGTAEATAKDIQRRIDLLTKDDKAHLALRKAKELASVLDDWNTIIENATRLSFYHNAVKSGALTEQQAALAAKELTTNFEAKGAWSPMINSLFMFANAGIQGSARLIQAGVKSSQTRKLMLGAVGMAFAMDMMNRAIGGDDKDGVPFYDKIPDNVRERYILLMNPFSEDGQPFKLPAPWGFNVLWVAGSELGKMVTGKGKPDPLATAGKLTMAMLNAFNPLQAATILQSVTPTILKPLAQVAENKSPFGTPLMPTNMPNERVPTPDSQLYWRSARPASQWIAKELNALTGGDAVRGSKIADVSPETLDAFWDSTVGAVGKFVADVVSLPSKAASGDAALTDVPFLRRFYGVNRESVAVTSYMENSREVFTLKEKLASKDISPEMKAEIRQDPRIKLIGAANMAESQLRLLRKMRRQNADEAAIKSVEEKMNKVYERFNAQYNAKTR